MYSHYRRNTVTLTKIFYRCGKPAPRTVDYPVDVWEAVVQHLAKIRTFNEAAAPLILPLKDDYQVITELFARNNTVYTGIHKMKGKSIQTGTGINMNQSEWNNLCADLPRIIELCKNDKLPEKAEVEVVKGVKRKLECLTDDDQNPRAITYVWKWVVNGRVIREASKEEVYFTLEDAQRAGNSAAPIEGISYVSENGSKAKLQVEFEAIDEPEPSKVMLLCYLTMLESRIHVGKTSMCTAHAVDDPSQFAHFADGNCADDTVDHLQEHFDNAKRSVDMRSLILVFSLLRSRYSRKVSPCTQIAETILQILPDWFLKKSLREGFTTGETCNLKDLVIEADKSMNNIVRD